MTTPGAATLKVPVAVKYGFGAFGSPVNNKANAINAGSGNLPLKWAVLGADNKAKFPTPKQSPSSPRPIRGSS